jgi:hypothetical protein
MSTTTRELGRTSWSAYFDSIAPSIEGTVLTVELIGEQLGDQTDVERLPVQAIGYDPKDDVLEVAVGGRGTATRWSRATSSRSRPRSAWRSRWRAGPARSWSPTQATCAR